MRKKIVKAVAFILISHLALSNPCFSEVPVAEKPKDAGTLSVGFDFKDADIKDVARAFSNISGINIIVSDDVKARVTLKVQNLNWKEALKMVTEAYNITLIEKENYFILTTVERLRVIEESGDLKTQVVRFNFVDVAEIKKTLTSMLSKRGKMEIDARTNSLVITDISEIVNAIQKVAFTLDTKTPQVTIEAMMLDLKLTDEEQMGIDWTMTHKDRPERSIAQTLSLTGSTTGEIRYGKTIFSWANLTALINLWQEEKRVNILANPRILTIDNLTAAIDLIEQIPYTQVTQSTDGSSAMSSTQFKDVGVKLYVKPHITQDNHVFLNIKTEQSFRSGYTPDNQPIVDSRKTETNLMVKDGETVVIGGLRKKEDSSTRDKFPILGDIPLLGKFFRRNNNSKVDTELVIFVTPYVSSELKLSEVEKMHIQEFVDMKLEGREMFSRQNPPFTLRESSGK